MKDFLAITDLETEEIYSILDRADTLYNNWKSNSMPKPLLNKRVALWSYGNGFRNRVAFELGIKALGGIVSFIPGELGVHEPLEDITHYLNNWFDLLVVRCKNHTDLVSISRDFRGPVVNARTTYNHPCEIIGDLQYIRRERGSIDNLNVVFVGEIANLSMSWIEAAIKLPIKVTQVAPETYLLPTEKLVEYNKHAVGEISTSKDLNRVLSKDTDVIYTDCWPKDQSEEIISELFLPYQIKREHVDMINPDGFFLPCPPISRGREVSEDSVKFPLYNNYEAKEFLLHAQNAILEFLVK